MEYISVVSASSAYSITSSGSFLANIYCATLGAWFKDATCQSQSVPTPTTSQAPNSKPQVPNTNQTNSQSSTPNLQPSSTSNTPAFSPHTQAPSSPSSPNIIYQGLTYADVNAQIQAALSKALGAQANYAGQNVTYAPVYQQISNQADSIGTSVGTAIGNASTNLTSSFNSAISSGLTGGTSAFNGTSLTVSSSTTIGGSLSAGSTTLSHLNVSGGANINGALTVGSLVSGGQTIGGNFNVSGITTLATTSITGALTVIGNTYITSGGILNVGDKIISPGDIGLGTSSPAAKLALQNTDPNQTAFLIVGTTSQSNPLIDIYNNPTSNTNLLRLSASGALSVNGTATLGGLSIGNLSGLLFSTNGIVGTTSTSSLAINTDNLVQGVTNLFWSNTLFDNRFNPSFDTRLFATTSLSNLATLAGLSTIGSSTGVTTILGKTVMTDASTTNLTATTLTAGNITATGTLVVTGTATSTVGTGGLTVGTSQFVVQTGTGNVGIGTAAPLGQLEVNNNASAGGMILGNYNSTTAGSLWWGGATPSNSNYRMYVDANATLINAEDNISFRIGGSATYMTVKNYGVGIGTANPGGTLDVSGVSKFVVRPSDAAAGEIAAGVSLSSGLNGGTTGNLNILPEYIAGTAGKKLTLGYYDGTQYRSALEYANTASGFGTLSLMKSGGNVGIGTTSPLAKLDIYGTAGSSDIFTLSSSSNTRLFTVSSNGNVGIGSSTPMSVLSVTGAGLTTGVTFQTANASNTPTMTVLDNGNVGIGKVAPATKLDVNGILNVGTSGNVGSIQLGGSSIINTTNSPLTLTFNGAGFTNVNFISGNVGINDAVPGTKFSVVGNAQIGYTSGQTAPANGLIVNGNVGIGTAVPTAALSFAAGSIINSLGALTINSSSTNALTLDSNTTGAINIGTNANAKTITIGNVTGATALALNTGTGNFAVNTNQLVLTKSNGYLGLGTASPANVISLGNSQAQTIWVENTNNIIAGKDLTVSAGSTVAVGVGGFTALNQVNILYQGMTAAPNGDIYAIATLGGSDAGVYKQSGGVGNFVQVFAKTYAYGIAAAPNGDIYAAINGIIYKQTGGSGSFVGIQGGIDGQMTAAPNGNIYVAWSSHDIYMQTNGAGTFNALSQGALNWSAMAAAPNGDVYAAINGGDIYKQASGAGNFTALSQTSRAWKGMTADAAGNIFATVAGGDIYMQTNGVGAFSPMSQTSRNWYGIAYSPVSGNLYASVYSGDIYMQTTINGTSNLAGGNLKLSAGLGKGTGASTISFFTGTTLTSGTSIQSLSEKMTILGNGNVGIGTTTPNMKLSLWGSGVNGFLGVSSTTQGDIFKIDTTGNVGIGSSTPSNKLTVNGNGYFTGNLTTSYITSTSTATSTFGGNISPSTDNTYSLGAPGNRWSTIWSGTTNVGDLVFGNNFRILEAPATSSIQAMIWRNQNGTDILNLDEYGNLNLTGDICANNVTCYGKSIAGLTNQVNSLRQLAESSDASSSSNYGTLASNLASSTQDIQSLATAIDSTNANLQTIASSTTDLSLKFSSLELKVNTLASSTMDLLVGGLPSDNASTSPTSFIGRVASAVIEYIQSTATLVFTKITSTLAVFTNVETQTASISDKLCIGSTCVNEDQLKALLQAGGVSTSTTPVATSTAPQTSVRIPVVVPSPIVSSTTTSTTSESIMLPIASTTTTEMSTTTLISVATTTLQNMPTTTPETISTPPAIASTTSELITPLEVTPPVATSTIQQETAPTSTIEGNSSIQTSLIENI